LRRGGLLRVLASGFGLAVIVGNAIGAGILRTPGDIARGLPERGWILAVWIAGALYALLGTNSLAELGAQAAPGARVVAGFHTISARALARVEDPLDEDVLLCGDDQEAKEVVAALAERLVEGRAVDAGRLEVARWLEPMTAVLLNVNRRYKVSSGIRVTGLP
jgi:hypothetical protein